MNVSNKDPSFAPEYPSKLHQLLPSFSLHSLKPLISQENEFQTNEPFHSLGNIADEENLVGSHSQSDPNNSVTFVDLRSNTHTAYHGSTEPLVSDSHCTNDSTKSNNVPLDCIYSATIYPVETIHAHDTLLSGPSLPPIRQFQEYQSPGNHDLKLLMRLHANSSEKFLNHDPEHNVVGPIRGGAYIESSPAYGGDRVFPCPIDGCRKNFKRAEHLRRHVRIHTGERPYCCPIPNCGRRFARSDNLTQHLRVHKTTKQRSGYVPIPVVALSLLTESKM